MSPIRPIGPISPIGPIVVLALLLTLPAHAARRAVLVGINDYTSAPRGARVPERDWADLRGSVNDLRLIQEMLVRLHGFEPRDIATLTDQRATRSAILNLMEEHLVKPAQKGDEIFFYYAGHGSQVRNSLSDEQDKLDETIVPADSLSGADDIRDKELRPLFNRILDKGAHLTIILDNCHSGSGARGLPSDARPRRIRPHPRDVADRTDYGPHPEDRGALVLSASQDAADAWERRDEQKQFHGAFSWAWIRTMRDAQPGETAGETFLRARARLRYETPFQEPVLAGKEAERRPFLGGRSDRRGERFVVPVEQVLKDGTVRLLAGWANGLDEGTELRLATDPSVRLTITRMPDLGRSEARMTAGHALPPEIRSGALLEVSGWAAPPAQALRIWMPRTAGDMQRIAGRFRAAARRRGVQWVSDPVEETATHVLRAATQSPDSRWELLGVDRREELADDDAALAAIAKLPKRSSLFVQLPVPASLIDRISIGPGTDLDAFEPVESAGDADYILAGRFTGRRVEYAWVRPSVSTADRRRSVLPLRSDWVADDAETLRSAVLRLRRVHAWQLLESPPEARSPYRLTLRRGGAAVRDGRLRGGALYDPVLSIAGALPATLRQRYFYVFTIDSYGKSLLAFPAGSTGSVENRFPLTQPPPREIPLSDGQIEILAPYGAETYYLLSTDEALPNPWILEWAGVRTRSPASPTALERLLLQTGGPTRGAAVLTPRTWSVEKLVFESVP